MKNETNISGNEQLAISELERYTSTGANIEKTLWDSPTLRALQVSQETLAVSSGTPAPA